MTENQLKDLCAQTSHVARSAADFIRSQVGLVADKQIETKERNSLVSYVDKKAEELLVAGLSALVPEAGFVTEEDTIKNFRNAYTWIIDPLDGTTNFLREIPIFSVSVALVHHDQVIVGCVVDIMQDACYYAWKDGGAWCDGRPISVSQIPRLDGCIIATGFPYYQPDHLSDLVEVLQRFLSDARGIRRLGSAALDLTYVACGKMDGFYETTLNVWDIAAGTLLVREAGGMVSDFSGGGEFARQQQIVASNGKIHEDMLSILNARTPA